MITALYVLGAVLVALAVIGISWRGLGFFDERAQRRRQARIQAMLSGQAATRIRLDRSGRPVPKPLFGNTPPPPPRFPVPPRPKPIPPPLRQRKPANPNLPRVECSICRHMITVNKNGRLRAHSGVYTTGMSCPGSGERYVDYVIHENPYQ